MKTIDQLKEIIASITSLEVSEILPDATLVEVVQDDVEVVLPRIIKTLNQELETDLDPTEIVELAQDEDVPLTVADLITMIEEELEF